MPFKVAKKELRWYEQAPSNGTSVRHKPTLWSPAVRLVSQCLGRLDDPSSMAKVLVDSVDALVASPRPQRDRRAGTLLLSLKTNLAILEKHNWGPKPEKEIARALEEAYDEWNNEERELSRVTGGGGLSISHRMASRPENPTPSLIRPEDTSIKVFATTVAVASKTVTVSDSEDGLMTAGSVVEQQSRDVDQEVAIVDFWRNLLEVLHLHIASVTTESTRSSMAYTVYRLTGPTLAITKSKSLDKLRSKIQRELLTLLNGCSDIRMQQSARFSQCRVYTLQRTEPTTLWVQISLGYPTVDGIMDGTKSSAEDFVAVIRPESEYVALSATSAASRRRFARSILSVLESLLTCGVKAAWHSSAQCVSDLSGSNPLELLHSAESVETKHAVGRYAMYAAAESTNPIQDLDAMDEGALSSRCFSHSQQATNGGMSLPDPITAESKGKSTLLVVGSDGVVLDHSTSEKVNRKRSRDNTFGQEGDCPRRDRVRWEWKGEAVAGAIAVLGEEPPLEAHAFKARVTLQGSDVFEGMRAMMEKGLMSSVPDYVREAPTFEGTIVVDHGAIIVAEQHNGDK